MGNQKSNRALCVVWQDVDRVVQHFPQFLQEFALVGNLRSAFGINIILYNLALNPHIQELIVWGPDKLSNTPIGIVGKNTLFELWKAEKASNLDRFHIVPEIDKTALSEIIQHVKVIEKSGEKELALQPFQTAKPYMQPKIFPEFVIKAEETLPSEGFGYYIRATHAADAYLSLLTHVWRYGQTTSIDAESEDVKEIRDAIVVIEQPHTSITHLPPWLSDNPSLSINPKSLEDYYLTQFSDQPYRKELFPGVTTFERPIDYSYLYAELMYAFPRLPVVDQTIDFLLDRHGYAETKEFMLKHTQTSIDFSQQLINNIEKSVSNEAQRITILKEALFPRPNQVQNVINRILAKPQDLDKEIVLWDQRYHTQIESGRPCVYKLSFSVRENIIDVHAFMRTHDVGKAWFFNFYGITRLLEYIAAQTGKKPGKVVMESQSAHIYKRDWETVKAIVNEQILENPARMFFDPERDGDPRGIVNISVVDGKIKIKLQDMITGAQLFEQEGKTARELMYQLKHHQLISRIDHGVFIGGELAKAELCIKLGIPYKYDNPIVLPNGQKLMP